jgi:hypothetical protein
LFIATSAGVDGDDVGGPGFLVVLEVIHGACEEAAGQTAGCVRVTVIIAALTIEPKPARSNVRRMMATRLRAPSSSTFFA